MRAFSSTREVGSRVASGLAGRPQRCAFRSPRPSLPRLLRVAPIADGTVPVASKTYPAVHPRRPGHRESRLPAHRAAGRPPTRIDNKLVPSTAGRRLESFSELADRLPNIGPQRLTGPFRLDPSASTNSVGTGPDRPRPCPWRVGRLCRRWPTSPRSCPPLRPATRTPRPNSSLVYDELRSWLLRLAAEKRPDLQATALVHEAYLRLIGGDAGARWNGRGHFFAAAAEAMRRILVDAARRKQCPASGAAPRRSGRGGRRGAGGSPRINSGSRRALARLQTVDPVSARLVELRYFAGLTMEQAADALGLPLRTVERNWAFARLAAPGPLTLRPQGETGGCLIRPTFLAGSRPVCTVPRPYPCGRRSTP